MIASVSDLAWLDAAIARLHETRDDIAALQRFADVIASQTQWQSEAAREYQRRHEAFAVQLVELSVRARVALDEFIAERSRALAQYGAMPR